MADLRELVAHIIFDGFSPKLWEDALDNADAVLAALTEAGVILPELPPAIDYFDGRIQEGVVSIRLVYNKYDPTIYANRRKSHDGIGPTIPTAIADALEDDHAD